MAFSCNVAQLFLRRFHLLVAGEKESANWEDVVPGTPVNCARENLATNVQRAASGQFSKERATFAHRIVEFTQQLQKHPIYATFVNVFSCIDKLTKIHKYTKTFKKCKFIQKQGIKLKTQNKQEREFWPQIFAVERKPVKFGGVTSRIASKMLLAASAADPICFCTFLWCIQRLLPVSARIDKDPPGW